MKTGHNFSRATRGPVVKSSVTKQRITIRLDRTVLDWFRREVHKSGDGSYQNLMNKALAEYVATGKEPLESILRHVIREELGQVGRYRSG